MNFKLIKFEKYSDHRGELVVFLKKSELTKKSFGQVYFVTFNKKGVVRGNHYHQKWSEWFGIVSGKLEVKLKDIKTGEEKKYILNANQDKYLRLQIGPNIAHSFKSLSAKASLLNYSNSEWNSEDTFKHKLI